MAMSSTTTTSTTRTKTPPMGIGIELGLATSSRLPVRDGQRSHSRRQGSGPETGCHQVNTRTRRLFAHTSHHIERLGIRRHPPSGNQFPPARTRWKRCQLLRPHHHWWQRARHRQSSPTRTSSPSRSLHREPRIIHGQGHLATRMPLPRSRGCASLSSGASAAARTRYRLHGRPIRHKRYSRDTHRPRVVQLMESKQAPPSLATQALAHREASKHTSRSLPCGETRHGCQ